MALLRGQGDPEALAASEDRAIRNALKRQEELGLDVLGDGEMRRFSFMGEITANVDGFSFGELPNPDWFNENGTANPGSKAMVVTSKITRRHSIAARETDFLKDHTSRPFKITLPSPLVVAQACWKEGMSEQAYPTRTEFMWAIADILREEIGQLAASGVPYIQIDNPGLAYYIDPDLRARAQSVGIRVNVPLEEAAAADAHCLKDLDENGPVVGMHLCRGNWNSSWLATGGYEPIVKQLFSQPRVNRFLLEYDTPRSGSFEILRDLPEDKVAVLGLLSTKQGKLEKMDTLLQRVEEASAYTPIERLAISPQCGFATSIPGNNITEEQQWAKIELVVKTARQLWGS